jgi:hypothetical protein
MKNVKYLLMFVTITACVFASSTRTNTLGGAGFWADDYANVWAFPADVNNHNVAYTSGNNFATIFDNNGTKWGFAGGRDANEVVNMNWGNGSMGARFGLSMAPEVLAADGVTVETEAETGYDIGFGMPLAGGNFGFGYNDGGTISLNLRRAQSVWLWDNMLIGFSMKPEDTEAATEADFASDMNFSVDCYTNRSYGENTNGLFALGFHYGAMGAGTAAGTAPDATMDLVWNFAVESEMTDWGTLRLGYSTKHDFGGGTNNSSSNILRVGLGINYGSFNLDMDISSSAQKVLKDPIKWAAGRNTTSDGSLAGSWTISYNW